MSSSRSFSRRATFLLTLTPPSASACTTSPRGRATPPPGAEPHVLRWQAGFSMTNVARCVASTTYSQLQWTQVCPWHARAGGHRGR
jgi:hypothetical protein